jgi:hypothetical protein
VDLDVFGSLMMNWVLRDLDGTLVVTVDDWWLLKSDAKFSEDILNPNNPSGSISNPSILSLSRRKSNGMLLLALPTNGTQTKVKIVARCRLVIIKIIPIKIRVSNQN